MAKSGKTREFLIAGLVALGMLGCGAPAQQSRLASSAGQATYAAQFPAELTASRERLETAEQAARATVVEFSKYPEKLKEPSWPVVKQVYQLADAEGKSEDYAQRFSEATVISQFVAEEKAQLTGRISGAAEQAAAKANCAEVELYGATAYALEHGVAQRLEERGRRSSDAQEQVTLQTSRVRERNVEVLRKQIEQISLASHVTYVGLERERDRLSYLSAQVEQVRDTLAERIDQLNKADASGMSRQEKKSLEDELVALQQAQGSLDSAATASKDTLNVADASIQALRRDYEKALAELLDLVDARAAAATQAASGT